MMPALREPIVIVVARSANERSCGLPYCSWDQGLTWDLLVVPQDIVLMRDEHLVGPLSTQPADERKGVRE